MVQRHVDFQLILGFDLLCWCEESTCQAKTPPMERLYNTLKFAKEARPR